MDVNVVCSGCGNTFRKHAFRLIESEKRNWKPYCSRPCLYRAKTFGKVLACGRNGCGKTFYRLPKEIRKVNRSYCSRACAAQVNNRLARKRKKNARACGNPLCSSIISGKLTYCSRACFSAIRRKHGIQDLILLLQNSSQKVGRTITKREMGRIADICVREFGSWNKALVAANLMPHRSDSNRMFKRVRTTAKDGHRCDSVSEAIIDNWLTEHAIAHTRDAAYPSTGHKADWSLGRDVFVEYFGLANDSARYDRSIEEKRTLCEKHRIDLIEIYPADIYPLIKLEKKIKLSRELFA